MLWQGPQIEGDPHIAMVWGCLFSGSKWSWPLSQKSPRPKKLLLSNTWCDLTNTWSQPREWSTAHYSCRLTNMTLEWHVQVFPYVSPQDPSGLHWNKGLFNSFAAVGQSHSVLPTSHMQFCLCTYIPQWGRSYLSNQFEQQTLKVQTTETSAGIKVGSLRLQLCTCFWEHYKEERMRLGGVGGGVTVETISKSAPGFPMDQLAPQLLKLSSSSPSPFSLSPLPGAAWPFEPNGIIK